MHLLRTCLSGAALVACALAQTTLIAITSTPTSVAGGTTFNITYAGGDGTSPVTLILREGVPSDLSTIETITTNASGGYYLWTVPTALPAASDYAFQILQGLTNINYSGLFSVTSASSDNSSSTSCTTSGSAASMGTGTAMSRNITFSAMSLTSGSTLGATTPASGSATTSSSATGTANGTANATGGLVNGAARERGSVVVVAVALGAILAM